MSRSNVTKISVSLVALGLLMSCATAPATPETGQEAQTFAKPTPEEIATAERADPLTRANFWNTQYNLHPTDLEISLAFSRALREIGSHDRAVEVASLTAVSFPREFDVHMEVGKAQAGHKDLPAAIRAYVTASNLRPDDAAPFAAIGAIYDQEGQHEIAQDAYVEALARDPLRPATLSNYGLSLALTGELDEAEAKLREATALPDASPKVRQNLALVLGLQGKFDEAREVAAIDAPRGVAERNADFLAEMIGADPRFRDQAASRPAEAALQPERGSETPLAAPSEPVASTSLADASTSASRPVQLRGKQGGDR